MQLCGRVDARGQGSLVLRGLSTCGSVHSCPTCAAAIMARRGSEIVQALEAHARKRTALVTFTLRHARGMSLRLLRTLLGRAYSELKAGRTGQRLRAELGHVGDIRSAEVTWGRNGWHPHLHALWFTSGAVPRGMAEVLADRWATCVANTWARMWRIAQETAQLPGDARDPRAQRVLGAAWATPQGARRLLDAMRGIDLASVLPQRPYGVNVQQVTDDGAATYLSKLGLELSSISSKHGRSGQYTAWQLASAVADGHAWARPLWREHHDAMLGARQLTWSRGLREKLGLLEERSDEELAQEPLAEGEHETLLGEIDGAVWDSVARRDRQLLVAELHQHYADGTLAAVRPTGILRPVVRTVPATVWWERLDAESRGARAMGGLAKTAHSRQAARDAPYQSAEERKLELEECRHKLYDLGLVG